MLCPDVNVLIDVFRSDAPRHATARSWIVGTQVKSQPIGVLPDAAAAFVRVVTNRRIWSQPSGLDEATAALEALLAEPGVTLINPPSRRWQIFIDLCRSQGLNGDDITDAYLAAGAMSVGATFVTSDRGFRRFPALKLEVLER